MNTPDANTMTSFLASYVETAFWSSTGGDDRPLDLDYGPEDLAPETLEKFRVDCESFNREIANLDTGGYREARIAHDFWLTRNRHGAGFWDGDYAEPLGEQLTDISHGFGGCDLYVGDDGKIYC